MVSHVPAYIPEKPFQALRVNPSLCQCPSVHTTYTNQTCPHSKIIARDYWPLPSKGKMTHLRVHEMIHNIQFKKAQHSQQPAPSQESAREETPPPPPAEQPQTESDSPEGGIRLDMSGQDTVMDDAASQDSILGDVSDRAYAATSSVEQVDGEQSPKRRCLDRSRTPSPPMAGMWWDPVRRVYCFPRGG
jgi:hypothetical protein